MPRGGRNLLLIELVIVIFFFALSAVITLQVFIAAFELSEQGRQTTTATALAQDWAEQLAVAEDPAALLLTRGWSREDPGDLYQIEQDGLLLTAEIHSQPTGAGSLWRMRLSVFEGAGAEDFLLTLPVQRYVPGKGATP